MSPARGPLARIGPTLVGAGYLAAWAGVRAVPEPLAARAFAAGAGLGHRRGGAGVRRLRANLARAVGTDDPAVLDAVTAAGLRSYARYWQEVFRLQHLPVGRVVAHSEVHGREHLDDALAAGRGVVCALPHLGNWDAAAVWLIGQGIGFTTVAERLEPAVLFDRFVAFRESLGMEVLALTGGERPPLDVLAERLRAGRVVCLLADRDLTASGVEVDFLGAATAMPAGPAVLAERTGAALLPVGLWFTERGWGIRFRPPVEPGPVAAMTQAMADGFAAEVREHPQDWHMLSRLWFDDLAPDDPRRAGRG